MKSCGRPSRTSGSSGGPIGSRRHCRCCGPTSSWRTRVRCKLISRLRPISSSGESAAVVSSREAQLELRRADVEVGPALPVTILMRHVRDSPWRGGYSQQFGEVAAEAERC